MSDVLCEVEPESASLEGWQIFADLDHGFQLAFPPSWTFEELELLPPEERADAEKALERVLVFYPQGWDGVAPPLHVQVTRGTAEEFALLYVPPTSTEELAINGNRVLKAVEGFGDGIEVTRYVFMNPADENIRIVLLDYISGFSERATGHEDVVDVIQQVLFTVEFVR
jgi:hypothetical protein